MQQVSANVSVITHPLAQAALTTLRYKHTTRADFVRATKALARFLAVEATRNLPTQPTPVSTVLGETEGCLFDETRVLLAPIMRAGIALLGALDEFVPGAQVQFIGMARDEETAE